jgi:hypothetical protein
MNVAEKDKLESVIELLEHIPVSAKHRDRMLSCINHLLDMHTGKTRHDLAAPTRRVREPIPDTRTYKRTVIAAPLFGQEN